MKETFITNKYVSRCQPPPSQQQSVSRVLVTSSVHSGHVARQPVAMPGATCRQLKEAALVSWSVGPPRPGRS